MFSWKKTPKIIQPLSLCLLFLCSSCQCSNKISCILIRASYFRCLLHLRHFELFSEWHNNPIQQYWGLNRELEEVLSLSAPHLPEPSSCLFSVGAVTRSCLLNRRGSRIVPPSLFSLPPNSPLSLHNRTAIHFIALRNFSSFPLLHFFFPFCLSPIIFGRPSVIFFFSLSLLFSFIFPFWTVLVSLFSTYFRGPAQSQMEKYLRVSVLRSLLQQ